MATITAIHIPPADANSPAQIAAAVSLPQFGPAADNAHLRVEIGAGDGYEYDEQIYGGPASSPVCVSIPPPADGSPRRVRAVAYARDRDGERILVTSAPATVTWPAAEPPFYYPCWKGQHLDCYRAVVGQSPCPCPCPNGRHLASGMPAVAL